MPTATLVAQPGEVVLAGGTAVEIRPVQPADADGLVEFYGRCSAESRYLRFHSPKPGLRRCEAEYLASPDGDRRVALVATGDDGVVADARLEPLPGDGDGDAEAAFMVRDDLQRCGLGGVLFARLIERAEASGYRRLLLHVLPENRTMVRLAGRFGAMPVGTDGIAVTFAVPLPRSGRNGG